MHDVRNAIQVGLTVIMGWLAVYFALASNIFVADHGFSYMARLGSQQSWAAIFLLVANVGVIGLMASNSAIRLGSVLIVATAHGVIAGCLILSDASVWSGTYAVIAGMGYYLAFKRARAGL